MGDRRGRPESNCRSSGDPTLPSGDLGVIVPPYFAHCDGMRLSLNRSHARPNSLESDLLQGRILWDGSSTYCGANGHA